MDTKKYLPLIVALSGCTTTATMSRYDINHMAIDCKHKNEQIAFLRSQYPDNNETLNNGLILTSSLGFLSSHADGTYSERKEMYDGAYTSAIRLKIDQIENQCAYESLSQQQR